MIKYHGTPFGGSNQEAAEALVGRHAFVSFAAPSQLEICLEVCQSVAFDNGAFSAWKSGNPIQDWSKFYEWVDKYKNHPRLDFVIIPDVIDGDEMANERLIAQWHQTFHAPYGLRLGVPVWHMHESEEKLNYLSRAYSRIAIGSSAEYSQVGSYKWHERMNWAMKILCDEKQPRCKVHMLRGLDAETFTAYPFASADSTNAGRNCNIDSPWKGTYTPPSTSWRARVIMARIESFNSSERWEERPMTKDLFAA